MTDISAESHSFAVAVGVGRLGNCTRRTLENEILEHLSKETWPHSSQALQDPHLMINHEMKSGLKVWYLQSIWDGK